jgi:hypothetical protein
MLKYCLLLQRQTVRLGFVEIPPGHGLHTPTDFTCFYLQIHCEPVHY